MENIDIKLWNKLKFYLNNLQINFKIKSIFASGRDGITRRQMHQFHYLSQPII